jgi:putative transposase
MTQDTLLRWHRRLLADKCRQPKPVGRPPIGKDLIALTVRLAAEMYPGCRAHRGRTAPPGHRVGAFTIRRILRERRIQPPA